MTVEQTLRVLYLNDVAGHVGGGETQLLVLATALRDAGLDFTVACIPGSPFETRLRESGIKVQVLSALRPNPLAAVFPLRKLCRELNIDLIHTSSFLTNISGRLAGKLAGIPVVTTVHCEPDAYLVAGTGLKRKVLYRVRDLIDRAMVRYTTRFIAVSRALADKMAARGLDRERIGVVPNGIDAGSVRSAALRVGSPENFGPLSSMASAAREGYLRIGTVARLDPVKGLDIFIKAVKVLLEQGQSVRGYIIGDGPDRPRLERLARELLPERAITFTGYVSNPYPLLAELDVYVLSSKSEGQPLTILDAMALGRPIVATAVGGVVDMVEGNRSGLLIEPGDSAILADAVTRISRNSSLRARLVEGGRAAVEEFSAANMAARTAEVYRRTALREAKRVRF